jgi:hypothetical protein
MDKTILRRWVETALDNMGQDPEDTIREDYSGRGMYSDTCLGFTLDNTAQIATLSAELCRQAMFDATDSGQVKAAWSGVTAVTEAQINAETLIDIVVNLFDAAREDSMGRGVIVYFPGWTLAED